MEFCPAGYHSTLLHEQCSIILSIYFLELKTRHKDIEIATRVEKSQNDREVEEVCYYASFDLRLPWFSLPYTSRRMWQKKPVTATA